jgi:hypothetical protein
MALTKGVVRGLFLAILASTSARGGSILYLGVMSGNWPASPDVVSPPPAAASVIPIGPVPPLQLGVFSGPGPASSTPIIPTAQALPQANMPALPSPAPSPFPSQTPLSSGIYDAYINIGSGPFPNSGSLTTGTPQPWYLGTSVDRLFGGLPTIPQATAFDATVLQRVQQTFALSGIPVSLTDNPNALAAHTISVVSQTSNPALSSALGMTYLGGNGFQYIDTAANSASSVDQLEWIVAHNLAHELMLAFGVPEINNQSGQFIDAPNASWSMMTNPNATFSPGAVADLLSKNFQAMGGAAVSPLAQVLGPPTVPEPSAIILWTTIASAGLIGARRRVATRRASRGFSDVPLNLP